MKLSRRPLGWQEPERADRQATEPEQSKHIDTGERSGEGAAMKIEVIYTTNDYTTVYDIIGNIDHVPTLDEWIHDIDNDDEKEQTIKALETGVFTFNKIQED